jgi:hypothetical protein
MKNCKVEMSSILVKEKTNKCTSSIPFSSHLFAPTCFGRHSTIIRVLDNKEYNKLQRLYSSKMQFLKYVIPF